MTTVPIVLTSALLIAPRPKGHISLNNHKTNTSAQTIDGPHLNLYHLNERTMVYLTSIMHKHLAMQTSTANDQWGLPDLEQQRYGASKRRLQLLIYDHLWS